MAWSTIVKLCLIVVFCSAAIQSVTAQGRGGGGGNQKLKEDVQFLKANLSALWDIVGELQKRASEERQDESEELVVSLGLKKAESWGPALKNQFDSQIRVKLRDDSKMYPAVSSTYVVYKGKDHTAWIKMKNTDMMLFWHRGTTLLVHLLKPDGNVQQLKLGDPIQDPDAFPQVNIPVGVWVAAELEDKFSYCLLSQIQAPGFEVSKMETGNVDKLAESYPQSEQLIKRLGPVKIPPSDTENSDSDY